MTRTRLLRLPAMLGAGLLLSACVAGQHLVLDSPADVPTGASPTGYARVVVQDLREDIVSGKEKPWYIGQYRAGLGVPWPVTTEGKIPLADQVRQDLEEELASLGFQPAAGDKQLEVLIRQWDFTGYQNGRFWYQLDIEVQASDGRSLASSSLGDELKIRGTFMLGARGGFERDMPGIYAGIIESVVRSNPAILDALKN